MSNPEFVVRNPGQWGTPAIPAHPSTMAPPTFHATIPVDSQVRRRLTRATLLTRTRCNLLAALALVMLIVLIGLALALPTSANPLGLAPMLVVAIVIVLLGPGARWRRVLPDGSALSSEITHSRILVDYAGLINGVDMTQISDVTYRCGIVVLRTDRGLRLTVPVELLPPHLAIQWASGAR
ncbi:hypothetical protein QNM97_18525 [Gordonia sp. L191]|uniref:hypothetical protein n=1 Tax=Gordonia sp. L191 TaxID=2982699 RepID=UPI0024BF375A|nr:hypothetical protein [Gordonia sp. L191]WHU45986.1 hypothetical protein QNM97_18525 [Gordonia sp. L191]